MKYIGNKTRLLDFIGDSMVEAGLPSQGTFIDIFGGTGSVGNYFKGKGYRIISNDIMTYSYVAQRVFIGLNHIPDFNGVSNSGIFGAFQILNNPMLKKEGFAFNSYAPSGHDGRQYFSNENAQRIDAVRDLIEEWQQKGLLSEDEYYLLVYCLIDAADFVANISGTYGAYLKIWRSMALKPLTLKCPEVYNNGLDNLVYQEDANKLIRRIQGDILYLDPPYNERQYAPNFHVLESLTIWDKPQLKGVSGQREYSDKKSLYCQRGHASTALRDLVEHADVKYIVMSYNNEGIIKRDSLLEILSGVGDVREYQQNYRRFRTESNNEHRHYKDCDDKVVEHLYIVEKHG